MLPGHVQDRPHSNVGSVYGLPVVALVSLQEIERIQLWLCTARLSLSVGEVV